MRQSTKKLNIEDIPYGSGRTDSGVHASAQVMHLDLPSFWTDLEKLHEKLNSTLHPHIHVKKIDKIESEFHARFSAKKRLYRYVIYDGDYQPFLSNYALHVNAVDVAKLHEILQSFVGTHNFEYFKKMGSETKTDTREIYKAGAYRHKNLTVIYFLGNSFLRSQVRIMCGFALNVMDKKSSIEELQEQLSKKARHSRTLVPPSGLYLARIYY